MDKHLQPNMVIFDLKAVADVDASTMQIFVEIIEHYQSRDIEVCFVRLQHGHRNYFQRSGKHTYIEVCYSFVRLLHGHGHRNYFQPSGNKTYIEICCSIVHAYYKPFIQ